MFLCVVVVCEYYRMFFQFIKDGFYEVRWLFFVGYVIVLYVFLVEEMGESKCQCCFIVVDCCNGI